MSDKTKLITEIRQQIEELNKKLDTILQCNEDNDEDENMKKDILEILEINKLHDINIKGNEVKIAVIDSNFKSFSSILEYENLYKPDGKSASESFGHGTLVSSIIKRVAPNAKIYGCITDGNLSVDQMNKINKSLRWCIDNKMDIAILSPYTPIDYINKLNNMGTIVVIPSYRNEESGVFGGQNTDNDNVISVSYITSDKKYISSPKSMTPYASKYIDCVGYGFGFEYIDSFGKKVFFDESTYTGAIWRTSFAACQVAGIIALLKQQDNTINNASKVRNILKDICTDVLTEGFDEKTGYGLIKGKLLI